MGYLLRENVELYVKVILREYGIMTKRYTIIWSVLFVAVIIFSMIVPEPAHAENAWDKIKAGFNAFKDKVQVALGRDDSEEWGRIPIGPFSIKASTIGRWMGAFSGGAPANTIPPAGNTQKMRMPEAIEVEGVSVKTETIEKGLDAMEKAGEWAKSPVSNTVEAIKEIKDERDRKEWEARQKFIAAHKTGVEPPSVPKQQKNAWYYKAQRAPSIWHYNAQGVSTRSIAAEAPKETASKPAEPKWHVSSDIAFTQGQTAYAAYKNSQWRIELNKSSALVCYGAGHGSWGTDKKFIIDYGTQRFWTVGSWRGPVIVFQKKLTKKLYAVLMEYDSGKKIVFGEIMTTSPAQSVRLEGSIYGAYIYITLEDGKQEVWSIYQYPNMPGKLVREQESTGEKFLYAMRGEAIKTGTGYEHYVYAMDVMIGSQKYSKAINSDHVLTEAEKFHYMYNYLSQELGRPDLANLIREVYNKNGKI